MHDPFFLAGKSEIATKDDLPIAQELLDTLTAHRENCVGMAANMIGVKKRIIAFLDESVRTPVYTVMLHPEIITRDGVYDTEEGCLSLLGDPRKCKRMMFEREDTMTDRTDIKKTKNGERLNGRLPASEIRKNIN